ncbi:hypothetical protein AYL99_10380 [Fonsecaea erecta]|uniref:Uncharacterized protein n=1 Tax=Fonsecaea erecta TaxID=1367422 RepID=A0A178Z6N0_9EURO|nr:hypothetical protein AYL99_10380 [Fonsecaea erecta]OAP55407.1 hypothetical protein AYL99_10380 [Fonsecaea erecta]
MPTNIPKRTLSPIKANSASFLDDASAATSGKAPQKIQLDAKEPTRLEPGPASHRATSDTSARLPCDPSKPRDSGVATKTSTRPTIAAARGGHLVPGHSRSQSSSYANTRRPTPSAPKVATATAFSRSQHAPSAKGSGDTRLPVSRSHHRALSASTRPRPNNDTGENPQETVHKANRPVAPHVLSGGSASSASGRPIVRPGRKPELVACEQHSVPKKHTTKSTAGTSLSPLESQHVAVRFGSAALAIQGTEAAHLEDELLQLSLVHEKSAATLQCYEASMKSQLKTGLEGVAHQLSTLRSLRHDRQANMNALAVSRWLDQEPTRHQGDPAGSDTLLLLSRCLEELQKISSVHGPLETAMKLFDEWHAYASSTRPTHVGDNLFRKDNSEEKAHCLHSLDPQWSALVSSVDDRVRACAALLAALHRSPGSSSIGMLIEMHRTLAEQIQQEICICRTVESLILRQQQERLARDVEQALSDVELHHSGQAVPHTTRMGIWDLRGKAWEPQR